MLVAFLFDREVCGYFCKLKMASGAELVVAAPPSPPPMTYRERLGQFRILEEKRCELIEVCQKSPLFSELVTHNHVGVIRKVREDRRASQTNGTGP